MHVGGDGCLILRPSHPRPCIRALLGRQVACINEIVLRVSFYRRLRFELFEFVVTHGVAQPGTLAEPRGKQQAAALLVGLLSSSAQVVLAGRILMRVGDEQVVHGRVRGESVARRGFDGRLQAGQFVHDGVSCKHGLNIRFESGHRRVHVKSVTSFGVVGSRVRIDAHDGGGGVDVVRERCQGAVATKHDHQISSNEVGTADVLSGLVIHLVVVAGHVMEDGFEGHQPLIVDFFEVFLEDDQDVQSSPLVSMHVALVQEHHPRFTDEKLSRSMPPWKAMQGAPPWGDSPEEQPNSGVGATPAPQPVSISDGFAPMNQGTVLTGTTQMPTGQLIYLQPPSSAAKVMGILLIIYGCFQALSLVGLFFEQVDPVTGEALEIPTSALALNLISTLAGVAGFIAAGVFLTRYEKRGVWVALGVIGAQFVIGIAAFAAGSDGGLGSMFGDSAAFGIFAGFSAFCSGICALIVAIPLMVSNNGLQ